MVDYCIQCGTTLTDCECEVCRAASELPHKDRKKAICCLCRKEADPCFKVKLAIAELDANELHQMATDLFGLLEEVHPSYQGMCETLSRWASS